LDKFKIKIDHRVAKFVEDNVYVEGRKIDLNLYEPMRFVYNLSPKELTILAGRQIGKSVYLGSKSSTRSILLPNNRILYVAPLESQVKTWSKTKLQKIIDDSEYIKKFFPRKDNNVFFKQNTLGSYIELTFASMASAEPARVRGKSADDLYIDETQDIVPDALPVIKETTTSSLRPLITYTGTAKSEDNLTGVLWKKSTQIERVYKCPSCSKYNIIERANIGEHGLICKYCKKPLDQKMSKFIVVEQKDPEKVAIRLPQVIMPIHQTPNKWRDVYDKFLTYSPDKFNQEVLGIPTGSGVRFLTIEHLRKLCDENRGMYRGYKDEFYVKYRNRIFMGIDWSGEGLNDEVKSRTAVLVMGHRTDGNIDVIYGEIIPPGDPDGTLERIKQIAYGFRVMSIGADAGMGAYQNAILAKEFGVNRMLQLRYVSSPQKPYKVYNQAAGIVVIDKTTAIDTVMGILRRDFAYPPLKPSVISKESKLEMRWPRFAESKPFFDDILAEFTQETKAGNKIWTHSPDAPDDSLHALVFGFFAYVIKVTGGNPLFY